MWRRGDRQSLQALLEEALARATDRSREGHAAIAQQLEQNKGILLENIQRVEKRVEQVDTKVDTLFTKVESLATWRTRLEGMADGTVISMRYLAVPAILFLLWLLYRLVVIPLFPGLKI